MRLKKEVTLLSSVEGDTPEQIYDELASTLTQTLPQIRLEDTALCEIQENKKYPWHATVTANLSSAALAEALWASYKKLVHAHQQMAEQIRLVFKLQDESGKFVRVTFCDPYSDKNIYMHCFEEQMESTFG
ncbi:MAG: hypothetical protein ACWA5X_04230 [bacterium]